MYLKEVPGFRALTSNLSISYDNNNGDEDVNDMFKAENYDDDNPYIWFYKIYYFKYYYSYYYILFIIII